MKKILKTGIGNKRKICRYCFSTENLTIDHKIPKSKGGTNAQKNLQYLCRPCNVFKDDLPDRYARGKILQAAALLRRLRKNNPERWEKLNVTKNI